MPAEPTQSILVCDDDLTARILLKETLSADHLHVLEADNGERAIAVFEAERPAMILLDVSMPGMDGFEVCRRIRAHPDGAHLPIVMVTGSDDIDSINQAYAVGATDFIAKPIKWPILGQRVKYILRASQAFKDLVTQQQKLHQLAYYDPLTGLPNRHFLMQALSRFLAMARRNDYQAGMLFIDLDRFKRINDTMGHSYGDKLLRKIAQRLQTNLRDSDVFVRVSEQLESEAEALQLSSFGGDEFTIFLSRLRSPNEAMLVAERVLRSFTTPFQLEQFEVVITPSIGISIYPHDGEDAESLLKNADTAMHFAKQSGRCCYKFYQDSMNAKAVARLQLEQDLRNAIKNQEILPFYQPQINVKTGNIDSVEALVRWLPAKGGVIAPDEFIPIAEETGMINDIGTLVLEAGCRQARQWLDDGHRVRVAINVSAHQFRQAAFPAVVAQALSQSGLPADLLELELTESVIMSDAEENIARLIELKQLGVTLAVDDFGTGYSSLSYLKRFPIDILKIDRSFVCDLNSSPDDLAIVEAILALATSLELGVIAEGIEHSQQIKPFHGTDNLLLQGYLFSRPVAAEYLPSLFEQNFSHLLPVA